MLYITYKTEHFICKSEHAKRFTKHLKKLGHEWLLARQCCIIVYNYIGNYATDTCDMGKTRICIVNKILVSSPGMGYYIYNVIRS